MYNAVPCFLLSFSEDGKIIKMNAEACLQLGIDRIDITGKQFEELLTVGSRIFFQTHFYPLIKMQGSAREIFLTFKAPGGQSIPVLLNVDVVYSGEIPEIFCAGMIISNRNRFEKELLEAKRVAEETLAENAELTAVKNSLLEHQKEMELQLRKLKSLKEQQQEIFKIITHDLQEPLRKTVFTGNFLLAEHLEDQSDTAEKIRKIIGYNIEMREMLLTLQRYEELENKNLVTEPVQLEIIIQEAIRHINTADGSVTFSYPSRSPIFYADRNLLTRFFIELFRNSLNNRDPQKDRLEIKISVIETKKNVFIESRDKYHYEKFVKLTYTDNGQGFLTDSSLVFQILQKSAHFNKINIGMAFCRRIVEKHMGSIVAKSVKGAGVGYTVFFPQQ